MSAADSAVKTLRSLTNEKETEKVNANSTATKSKKISDHSEPKSATMRLDISVIRFDSLDIPLDFESLNIQETSTSQKQSLSRKNSLSRSSSLTLRTSRTHRKLCRQKAVYSRPSLPSCSPQSSDDSLNEEKFMDKKNLEDLEVTDKNPFTPGRFKSQSLSSSFTYRAITPVAESVLE